MCVPVFSHSHSEGILSKGPFALFIQGLPPAILEILFSSRSQSPLRKKVDGNPLSLLFYTSLYRQHETCADMLDGDSFLPRSFLSHQFDSYFRNCPNKRGVSFALLDFWRILYFSLHDFPVDVPPLFSSRLSCKKIPFSAPEMSRGRGTDDSQPTTIPSIFSVPYSKGDPGRRTSSGNPGSFK